MDDYGVQDSSNFTDTYASNSYSYDDNRGGGGYENDRSNDFSFAKENDSFPTKYQALANIYPSSNNDDITSNSNSFPSKYQALLADINPSNNDDVTSKSNTYENDRSNDFSFSKENDSTSITNQTHTGKDVDNSSKDDDLIGDTKQDSNSDTEDLPSKNGLENGMSEKLEEAEDSDLKNINFKVDQYSQNANEDTRSDRFRNVNESTYDDYDCCSCKNNPLMCLAFFCDCFGL